MRHTFDAPSDECGAEVPNRADTVGSRSAIGGSALATLVTRGEGRRGMRSDDDTSDHGGRDVLLWVPRYWPAVGGTELHTRTLAAHLASRRAVRVITHCDVTETAHRSLAREVRDTTGASRRDGAVPVHRIGLADARPPVSSRLADRYQDSRLARVAFGRAFARHVGPAAHEIARRTELIHVVYNGLTEAATLARRVADRRGVPYVLTPNVVDTTDAPTAWNSFRFRRLYRSATRLIALTEHEAEWLVGQGARPEAIRVVPYGPVLEPDPDPRRAREALGIGEAPLVLFLGRVVDIKGYDLLLGARGRIRSAHPDAHIVFMGPATPASRAAIGATRDARVHLVEGADQRLKSDTLAACDLMCLPSRGESLGVAYIEAAFNARPAVCLDLPVLRSVVEHERHGLRVPEDADAVAGAVCRLLGDPELRRSLGERFERDARARYAWSTVRDAVSSVYDEALGAVDDRGRRREGVNRSGWWRGTRSIRVRGL